MAEAFAHIHGGEKVEAYSAGSRPSGVVNPKAIEAMRELGYDLSRQRSRSIVDLPDIEFDFVATMGCGDACPFVRAKHREDWDIPDPKALAAGGISRRSRSHWEESQNSAGHAGLSTHEAKVERAVPYALLRFRRRSRTYLASPRQLPGRSIFKNRAPDEFRAVRDLIERKVKTLLATL
jgi:protein-tyrosine-phosphatase